MDRDGYPEEDELEKIRTWPVENDFLILMNYIGSLWRWDNYFVEKRGGRFEFHTGGWSGNEELIGALMDNQMFWILCWRESKVGGHYKFWVRK